MNIVKNVLNYYFKNFIYILILAIIPAVVIGVFMRPFALIEFLSHADVQITTFGSLISAVYGIDWLKILMLFVCGIVLIVMISAILRFIETHFRTGEASIANAVKINSNVLSVTKILLVLAVIGFVVNFLALVLVYLTFYLTAVDGYATVWTILIGFIFAIGGLVPVARALSVMSFAVVEMITDGSSMRSAVSNGFTAIGRHSMAVWLTELVLFGISIAFVVAFSVLGVAWIGNILALLVLIPGLCIGGMEMFYDYYGFKKYNNRKYYNLR